jgi:tetratricopeptide (TPR) repeat protein
VSSKKSVKIMLLKTGVNLCALATLLFGALSANALQSYQQDTARIEYETRISGATDSIDKLNAYFDYGMFLDAEGETENAITNLEVALQIAENSSNYKEMARVANSLAALYLMVGDLEVSTAIYKKALECAEKTEDNTEIAKISMNLAGNYSFNGDYNNAIKYGLYALKIKETTNNWVRICYHYMAMSNIFKETGNLEKRKQYVQRAYKMKDVEGCASVSDIAKIYNGLGGIAEHQFKHEEALAYYDTLKVFSEETGFTQGIGTALTNSSLIYIELKEYEKALEMVLEAEEYSNGTPYDTVFSNNCKIEIYWALNQPQKALELAIENISKEEMTYYSAERLKCLQFLYELNFVLGHYSDAYNWNDSLHVYQEYLRDEDVRSTIEDLETKYQTEKKEQQIELLTTENLLRRRVMQAAIVIVIILVLLVALILYILRIRRKQAKYIQNELQQQVLRSQMNPHFIFNVLGSIQNFMLANDSKKAAGYLSQFASLTRATLEYSSEDTISLSDELNMLKNYIELERMRFQNKFDYQIDYDENLELDFIKIPPMMIQPFIENAIKHGLKKRNEGGLLKLQIADKTDWIEFVIEDNGEGMPKMTTKPKGHKSMAMKIFEKRRKLIQQKNNKDFEYRIQNLKDLNQNHSGVRIIINIPVLNE